MCELFGLSCNDYDRATKALPLFAEKGAWSSHGWGIGYYRDGEGVIERYPEAAINSSGFKRATALAKSRNIIAHVRYMTRGHQCEENCHPFKLRYLDRDWIFAHNGQVPIHYPSRAGGDTDSSSVFTFMMDQVNEYIQCGRIRGLYPAIMKATQAVLRSYGRDITFNYILSDGTLMYVFSHYRGKKFYFLKRSKAYGGAILVATGHPLTGENWQIIPPDRLFVLNNGEIEVLSDAI